MATQEQRVLFAKLRKEFGSLGYWKALTTGQNVDAMSDHEAMHYLVMLLEAFPDIRIESPCDCGKPLHEYVSAKSPADQPGSAPDPRS